MADYIAVDACEPGRLYRIRARNFQLAVFAPPNVFIGMRHKFGEEYLFGELHYDTDNHYGTVQPVEALDEWAPDGVPLAEYLKGDNEYLHNEPLHYWVKEMVEKHGKGAE